MNSINAKIIRQIFTLLLIVLMGVLIFREMIPYLSGVLGAITLYVLLKGIMGKLINRGWNPNLAAALLMLLSFISILLPIAGAVLMLGNKIGKAAQNSEKVVQVVKNKLEGWEQSLGYNITDQIDASSISNGITKSITNILGGTFSTFIAISIMYFLLFYMLTNRKQLRETLIDYIPISKDNVKTLGKEVHAMVRSNAIGIPLVALAQGFVALIGFLIFGVESPFFWAVVVTIGSMIPFVGNFLGTIPVFILAISNGDTFQAWGVLLYGIVVVGVTDNLIRLYVLKRLDNVHPLITLIGVIIGIPLFGFIGLVFGPLLISLFLLVVRIYKKEYGKAHNRL
ncbi:putative PurR-regulated permease PerM [Mariniflexile fucanivorans]|uniref:Putative PurR-regulated permease PerM n=1 Tax=Mariniflexile fucanivorans TaxID=264023 RepID=A0A4R1RNV3_9FLAO|nr:AI-2E family transporter [Mariniflexile fucanivorans]TCL67610.1 putative PurR-regulated permease PerM [Mariniflexile fucanivorans]